MLRLQQRCFRNKFLISVLVLLQAFIAYSLRANTGSQCASLCNPINITSTNEIVCYDYEFSDTSAGSTFQSCVECELESTYVDSTTGLTDVSWGIYNLRYAVSTCIYGFPEAKTALSTPCQVSCASLEPAVDYDISNGSLTATPDFSFCNQPSWDDTIVNGCVFCYNWTSSERYISNFMQALHNACKDPPPTGSSFPIAASQIFSSTEVSSPPTSTAAAHHSGLGSRLALVVALPVVFGVIIFVTILICCTRLVISRRRRMAASGNMDRVHAGAWGNPNIANVYTGHGTYPSPKWRKHSPGFASTRNSGMGWAKDLSPINTTHKHNSQGSYYEGWGNTFNRETPDAQQNDPSSFSSPTTTTTKQPFLRRILFPTPPTPPNNQPQPQPQPQPSDHKPPILIPIPISISRPPDQKHPPLALQIPSPTQPRHPIPRPHPHISISPQTHQSAPHYTAQSLSHSHSTSISPEEYDSNYNYNNYNYNFQPYHDISSPESAGTGTGAGIGIGIGMGNGNGNGRWTVRNNSGRGKSEVEGETFAFEEWERRKKKEKDDAERGDIER